MRDLSISQFNQGSLSFICYTPILNSHSRHKYQLCLVVIDLSLPLSLGENGKRGKGLCKPDIWCWLIL